jgi:23S rRNA pseudouridine1911/1915/1917 synthase
MFLYELIIPPTQAGHRLDVALAALLSEHSRARIAEWIKSGAVLVDDDAEWKPKDKVRGGEAIVIEAALPEALSFGPEPVPLNIVYEDTNILVLNKPVGCVVHPGAGNLNGTLLNGVLYHAPECAHIPRAGIVHRIDKDTSGLLVVAKTLLAHTALIRALQARTVKREYRALVWGEMSGQGTIDAPIGRHPTQRVKMAVVPDGKEARTHYTVLESFDGACTLLACQLESGRTHQIRVHCAYKGHALVGDPVYATPIPRMDASIRAVLEAFPRQALHGSIIAIMDHLIGQQFTF